MQGSQLNQSLRLKIYLCLPDNRHNFLAKMASTNANGYWEVCSNLIIQERDYVFYIRYDSNQGAVIKIEKMGGSEVLDKIDMTLESAIEIEDRLRTMERRFNQIDPRFTNETLLSEDVDGVYHLSLSVIGNNPVLYVHHKRLKTNESMIIQGFPLFRCHLFDVIEELSIKYLDLKIVKWEESGARVVRGERVAVIFCPSRPWPWINSDWTEQLLFDP